MKVYKPKIGDTFTNKKKLWIATIAIVVVIAIAIAIVFLVKQKVV